MDSRAGIELADFKTLFDGDDSEDIENKLLAPYREHLSGNGIQEIDIALIDVFPNHPFKVTDDAKMDEMVESIRQYGVIHPVLVRKLPGGRFQMISGHRRTYASRKAGLSYVPARVMELTDEEAIILMTNTNFLQRTNILPSEKAKAYRMRYEAIKRQGKSGGSSFEEIGESASESGKTVQRFIRLSYLIDEFLSFLDSGRIGVTQGVELSFLTEDAQRCVYHVMKEHKLRISKEQAARIKELSKEMELTEELILQLVNGEQINNRTFEIKEDIVSKYFGADTTVEEIEKIILELLEKWKGEQ